MIHLIAPSIFYLLLPVLPPTELSNFRPQNKMIYSQWAEHEAEAHPQHTEVPPTTPAVSGTLSCMLFSPVKSKSTTVISLPLMPHAARGVERRRWATCSGSSICT